MDSGDGQGLRNISSSDGVSCLVLSILLPLAFYDEQLYEDTSMDAFACELILKVTVWVLSSLGSWLGPSPPFPG